MNETQQTYTDAKIREKAMAVIMKVALIYGFDTKSVTGQVALGIVKREMAKTSDQKLWQMLEEIRGIVNAK